MKGVLLGAGHLRLRRANAPKGAKGVRRFQCGQRCYVRFAALVGVRESSPDRDNAKDDTVSMHPVFPCPE